MTRHTTWRKLGPALLVLLLAVWLRAHGLGDLREALHHDEAYYALDALSLIEAPRIQPFFATNTGREGGWMMVLAPLLASIGPSPFTLRLAGFFAGVLAVALAYRLGDDAGGPAFGHWTAAALAVIYWHVQMNHIAFRANLHVPVGLLAIILLWRAYRLLGLQRWLMAGLATGLLAYTYTAAHLWVAYIGLTTIIWAVWDQRRRQAGLVPLVAGIVALPVWLALLTTPQVDVGRTAIRSAGTILENLWSWARAWTVEGDPLNTHNLPGLPVFDLPLLILALAGLLTLPAMWRWRGRGLWFAGLAGVSLAPSLITLTAPHYLRGNGVLVPLVLLLGLGGVALARVLAPHAGRTACLLPAVLFGGAALNTYGHFDQWLSAHQPGLYIDDRVNAAFVLAREQTSADLPLVFVGLPYHPVADFRAQAMGRPVTFYAYPEDGCFITPGAMAVYIDFPIVVNQFVQRAQVFSQQQEIIYRHPAEDYNLTILTLPEAFSAPWPSAAHLGESISMQNLTPLSTAQPGQVIDLSLGMRFATPPDQPYRIFLHLYEQGPDGLKLITTGDVPLCENVLTSTLTGTEIAIQVLRLSLPIDLPVGGYSLGTGFYLPDESFTRLPIVQDGEPVDYYEAGRLRVES